MLPAPKIQFDAILASKIIYDNDTGLFPFSPRLAIDERLVEQLKQSLIETGFWEPVVVRAKTMEGIAGNHRFLAYLAMGRENGVEPDHLKIPTALVDCDEGTAVSIALMENEIRADLTQLETLRALLRTARRKPRLTQTVFEVDGEIVEQLKLWEKELPHTQADEQPASRNIPLTREWLTLVKTRLADYPDLRQHFLTQLKQLDWVQSRSLADLNQSITEALKRRGMQFQQGKTWLSTPIEKCFNYKSDYAGLLAGIEVGKSALLPDINGVVGGFCSHLRLFPHHLTQFVPNSAGQAVFELNGDNSTTEYPAGALTEDGKQVRGDYLARLDRVEAYCVAPDARKRDSCFHRQEATAQQALVDRLQKKGLPAVSPSFVHERKSVGEFVWLTPQRDGQTCVPETCFYAGDEQPGFVAIIQPDGDWQMVCIHAECGIQAQDELEDKEAKKRRELRRQHRIALNKLRQRSVEKTLLAKKPKKLNQPKTLAMLEPLLTPEWDTVTMQHVVIGWQQAMRDQIVAELGNNPKSTAVTRVFRERFPSLAEKPTDETINRQFLLLRETLVKTAADWEKWLTCLATVRSWRDEAESLEMIEEMLQKMVAY